LCKNYQNENLIDIIRLLIEKGIDVNCENRDGDNALHFLCANYKNENLIDIIRLLIEKGIDVNYKDIVVLRQNYRKENCSQIVDLLKQHTSYRGLVRYYCSQIGLALVYCFRSYCRPYAWRTIYIKIAISLVCFPILFFIIYIPLTAEIDPAPATTTVPTATPDPFVNNDSFINKAFHD
jgi:hypothetical protein